MWPECRRNQMFPSGILVSLGTDDGYGSSVHLSEGDSIGETATWKQAKLNPS